MEETITEQQVRQVLKGMSLEMRVFTHVQETLAAYLEKKEVLKQFERMVVDYKKQLEGMEAEKSNALERQAGELRAHKDKLTQMEAEAQAKVEEITAINLELVNAQSKRDAAVKEREAVLARVNGEFAEAEKRLEKVRAEIGKKFAALDALR